MGCIYAHILKVKTSSCYNWVYIGQTTNIDQRWHNNRINHYRGCRLLYRVMKKYGWDAFDHIIIEDNIPTDKLDEREEYWIRKLHTFVGDPEYKGGFNLTWGGEGTRGPHPSQKGIRPKNIEMLTEMKYKKVTCVNSGVWKNKEFYAGQTWNSVNECADYFKTSRTNIWQRTTNQWRILNGPIFETSEKPNTYNEDKIKAEREKEKERQRKAGLEMSKQHKSGSKIAYTIYCEETKEYFDTVISCMQAFGMARSTLNGHILHPEKHPTAKGCHFKRIPKTEHA